MKKEEIRELAKAGAKHNNSFMNKYKAKMSGLAKSKALKKMGEKVKKSK